MDRVNLAGNNNQNNNSDGEEDDDGEFKPFRTRRRRIFVKNARKPKTRQRSKSAKRNLDPFRKRNTSYDSGSDGDAMDTSD